MYGERRFDYRIKPSITIHRKQCPNDQPRQNRDLTPPVPNLGNLTAVSKESKLAEEAIVGTMD
jgi:hypothetical protein